MAFVLTNIDRKPMKLKGKSQFAGIAVSDSVATLTSGQYRGLRTNKLINVLSAGGRVFPDQDSVIAHSICKPIPVSIDEGIKEVEAPLEEVFVQVDRVVALQELRLSRNLLQDVVKGYWIPVNYIQGGVQIGTGWINQLDEYVDALLVSDKARDQSTPLQIVPIHALEAAFEVK